jgi:hypothetical protein
MSQVLKNMQNSIDKLRKELSNHIKSQDKNNENILLTQDCIKEITNLGYNVNKVSIDSFNDTLTIKFKSDKLLVSNRKLCTRTIHNLEDFIWKKMKNHLPTQQEIIQNLRESITQLEKDNEYSENLKDELLDGNLRNAINKVILEDS